MSRLRTLLRRLHLAAAFLTIVPGPRLIAPEEMEASVPFYPAIGLGLGLFLGAGAVLLRPLFPPAVLGWLLVAINILLTRGLHWDGLADVADAWGAGAQGGRFWAILKDSRTGAFGVLAVTLGIGLQATAAGALLAHQRVAPIILAPVFGRVACLALAHLGRSLARPGLGAFTLRGATSGLAVNLAAAAALAAIFLPPERLFLTIGVGTGVVGMLLHLGRRHGGLNGDFLGATVVLTETATLVLA